MISSSDGTAGGAGLRLRVMTTSHAVDLWLGELERKNHSERTIDTYRRLLDKLADAHPHIDVDELSPTMIRRFLDEQSKLQAGGRKAPRTIAQNVTIVNGFLDWLTREGVLARNPSRRNGDRILSRPTLPRAEENDNVTSVSGDEVRRLLARADVSEWNRRIAVNLLAYMGPRRKALAIVRRGDYDQDERMLTFREKGGKTIAKPVPDELADLLDAAIASGLYETDDDYLVPGRAQQRRKGDRDDRIIWHLVRDVAKGAGVVTHVHALRAAFAVHYLETHRDEHAIFALRDLMGHRRIETTLVYLRRLERRQAMETVRDLTWRNGQGEIRTREPVLPDHPLSRRAPSATRAPVQKEPLSGESLESSQHDHFVGSQPSFEPLALLDSLGRERGEVAPIEEV